MTIYYPNGKAEPGGSLDAENVCGADVARPLAAQVTLIVRHQGILLSALS